MLCACGLLFCWLSLIVCGGCRGLGTPEFKPQPATIATPPVPPGAVRRAPPPLRDALDVKQAQQAHRATAKAVAAPPAGTPHVFEGSTDLIAWTPVSTQSGPQFFMRVVPLTNAPPATTNPPVLTLATWDAVAYPVISYTLKKTAGGLSEFVVTTNTSATFANLAIGGYDFSVLALRWDGVASAYSSNASYTVP